MSIDKLRLNCLTLEEARAMADEIERLSAETDRWKHHHDVQVSRKRNLKCKLETAIEAIKFAESKGFEWPTDPFAAIEQASTDWPPEYLKASVQGDGE